MTIQIGDYLVAVKAKLNAENIKEERMNKRSTMAFLNTMNCMVWDSMNYREQLGLMTISMEARKIGNQIYDELDKRGMYEGLR